MSLNDAVSSTNLTELLHAETINFSPNTTKIVAESRGALEKIAKILLENPGVVVNVEGHVWVPDSKRNDPKMMRQATKLSAYRAKSVVKSLRKRGVAKTQLTAEGFGGSRPLSEGEDSKRVEIKVVGLPENDDILDAATSQIPTADLKVDSSVDSSVLEIRFLDATKSEELQITKQCIADFNHGFPGKALACPLVVGKRIDGEGPVHGYKFQQPIRILVPLSMRTTATSRELFNIEVLHKADDDENTPWTVVPHSKFSILKGVNKLNAKQEFCAITVEHLCYFMCLRMSIYHFYPHVAARAEQYRNARSVHFQTTLQEEQQTRHLEDTRRSLALAEESAKLAERSAAEAAEAAKKEQQELDDAEKDRRLQERMNLLKLDEAKRQEQAKLQMIQTAKEEAEAARKRVEEEKSRREKAALEKENMLENVAGEIEAEMLRTKLREKEEQERRKKEKEEAQHSEKLQRKLALAAAEEEHRAAEQLLKDEAIRIKAIEENRQKEDLEARKRLDEDRRAAATAAKEASRLKAESERLLAEEAAEKERKEKQRQQEADESAAASAAAAQEA